MWQILNKMKTLLKKSLNTKDNLLEESKNISADDFENFLKKKIENNEKDFYILIGSDKERVDFQMFYMPDQEKMISLFLFSLFNNFLTESFLSTNIPDNVKQEFIKIEQEALKAFKKSKKEFYLKNKNDYISPLKVLKGNTPNDYQ